jgi:hypothetical protein
MPEREGSEMKYINRKQTLIVTGNTAPEFQQNLNDALNDLARKGFKHELQFNMAYGLCAYIIYEERFEEAETLADQYELKGETYKCYECPMYNPSTDRRVKYTTCKKGERHIYHSCPACDWFYEELEKGGIRLNGEEETA